MAKYTTYEEALDRIYTGADTRTEKDWYLYFLLYVDKKEYPDFTTWLEDMLGMSILIPEK